MNYDQLEEMGSVLTGYVTIETSKGVYMNACDEVAYIESTGLEYIDTGYIPTVNTYTKTKFMITNTNPTTQFVFGSKNSTYSWEGYAVFNLWNSNILV